MIAGSSPFFPVIHMKYVVFMSLWPRIVKILISNWPRTRKFSHFFKNKGREDLFLPWSRVGHALRPIFVLRLVKIWQVSSCGKFMQHLESCLLWQLKLTDFFLPTCNVFNCLFLLDVQNEIHLLSRVFCSSWLVCLLGFGWEMLRLSQSVIRFRMASLSFCLMRKRV